MALGNTHRGPFLPKQVLLGLLISFFYRIYSSTFRYRVHFQSPDDKKIFYQSLHEKKPNLIYAFYHQLELVMIPYFIDKGITILVSPSKDGEILATALKEYGLKTIRGSSSKKPIASLIKCIEVTRRGESLAIATDGPKGPAFDLKPGVIKVAEKTNTPIIPLSTKVSSYKILNKTWDKTIIPYPFSKIDIYVGKIKSYQHEELQNLLFQDRITS